MRGKGRPFQKGTSGNPSGRPRAANAEFISQFNEFSEKYARNVIGVVFREAINGDMRASKIVFERHIPTMRERNIQINVPNIHSTADAPQATEVVMRAVTDGVISPGEGETLLKIITAHIGALVAADHASRLDAIEAHLPGGGTSASEDASET